MASAYRYTTVAGNAIFTRVTGGAKRTPGEKRAQRTKPTTEEVKKINQRYAEWNLAIKINYNFTAGDYHLVFTYAMALIPEESKKIIGNFLRTLTKAYRKRGLELKWILTTEYKHARIHHHVIMNAGLSLAEIEDLWGRGGIRCRLLNRYGHYYKLASYIIKETKKTFTDVENPYRRRFNCSRTIVTPTPQKDVVSQKMLDKPVAAKGYFVDPESVHEGICPMTNKAYMEYIQIAINNPITKWKRGHKAKDPTPSGAGWLAKNADRQIDIHAIVKNASSFDEDYSGNGGK